MDFEDEHTAYKFVGALFRDRVFSAIDWFDFEDTQDGSSCDDRSGRIWKRGVEQRCPDCEERGWRFITNLGMRLRYQFAGACFETLIYYGLMKTFSHNDRFWDEVQIPRKGSWWEHKFRAPERGTYQSARPQVGFVPMRTVPARPVANPVEPVDMVSELRRFLNERQRRMRQESAAARKAKSTT